MEIERKFTFNVNLLELFPLPLKDSEESLGGWKSEKTYYLPNSGDYDIRLRWKENFIAPTWKLTIKNKPTFSSKSLNRLEIEKNLSDTEVEDILEFAPKCLETKRITFDLYTVNLHFFKKETISSEPQFKCEARILPNGLIYGEIEFQSEDEALKFRMKDYSILKEDVTNNPDFYFRNIYEKFS